MSRKKHASKAKRVGKAGLPLGVVGLSLSLAGAVSADSGGPAADAPSAHLTVDLHEEEVFDVTMASFYVFDKENPGGLRSGQRVAAKTSVPRYRGCGTGRRCGSCRGCGGCRGCRD